MKKALCNVSPGQTVKVAAGVYKTSVCMVYFGDTEKTITILGEDGAVLDGDNELTVGIAVIEGNNFRFENLEFRNYTDEGLLVSLGGKIKIINNTFTKNGRKSVEPDHNEEGFGLIVTEATDVLIEENMVTENGPNEERRKKPVLGTGIDTYGVKDLVIRKNTSSNNIGGGILVEDGANVVVEENTIENNDLDASADYWWDAGIWVDGGNNVTLKKNTIKNNKGPGIQISDADLQYHKNSESTRDYSVEANTITGNFWKLFVNNFGQCPMPQPDVLDWGTNNASNNSYDGPLDSEFEEDKDNEILCIKWPCGEMTACTGDH